MAKEREERTQSNTPGDSLWKNIFSGKLVRKGSAEDILRSVPAFTHLSVRELKEVAEICHYRDYRAGETVFAQGDPGLGMYIVQEGDVRIVMNDREGRPRELSVLSVGDFFGEMGLIDESPRSATALCRTDCRLIGFFRPDLFELIDKDPRLGIKIVLKLAEIVAERLRNAQRLSEDYADHVLRTGEGSQPVSTGPTS
jgi:CRP/FNR family transcriptional regulator, cyclic AMP receptor protein